MASTHRDALLQSIATTIAVYRKGEVPVPTPAHVDKWVKQFEQLGADATMQLDMLYEMDHILRKTYVSRARVVKFLSNAVAAPQLVGNNPFAFWKSVNFLRLQQQGNSQADLLEVLDTVLRDCFGFTTGSCGSGGGPYFYLDDCLFTGNRILHDLSRWLDSTAPVGAQIHVVVVAQHTSGQWYAQRGLSKLATQKRASVKWWRGIEIEDRRDNIDVSEVLRPARLPDDPLVREYQRQLIDAGFQPVYRRPGGRSKGSPFSSEARRDTLEQMFLRAGVYIQSLSQDPNPSMRPLGATWLRTFGFGALIVTYRNCANNCPLALWWGDPNMPQDHPLSTWYPLFPRKVNEPRSFLVDRSAPPDDELDDVPF